MINRLMKIVAIKCSSW